MCTCGLGVFPHGYLKNMKQFKVLSRYAVRAAIPVIYASPISNDGSPSAFNANRKTKPKPTVSPASQHKKTATPRLDDLDAKKGTCFKCGAGEPRKGDKLLKCGGCHYAQYCSKKCQVENWKEEHKHICKQLKDMSN